MMNMGHHRSKLEHNFFSLAHQGFFTDLEATKVLMVTSKTEMMLITSGAYLYVESKPELRRTKK
jgi:hypothetical protein